MLKTGIFDTRKQRFVMLPVLILEGNNMEKFLNWLQQVLVRLEWGEERGLRIWVRSTGSFETGAPHCPDRWRWNVR